MLTRFVRRQIINNRQLYRYLSIDKNNNLNNNDVKNNGYIKAEDYCKDAKYDMIRADLDKIDNKVEWLIILTLPTWITTMLQAIYTLLH